MADDGRLAWIRFQERCAGLWSVVQASVCLRTAGTVYDRQFVIREKFNREAECFDEAVLMFPIHG